MDYNDDFESPEFQAPKKAELDYDGIYKDLELNKLRALYRIGEKIFVLTFNHFLANEAYEKCVILKELETLWLKDRESNVSEHFKQFARQFSVYKPELLWDLGVQLTNILKQNVMLTLKDDHIYINGNIELEEFLVASTLKEEYQRDGFEYEQNN